jgi:hypothetical protein
MSNLICPVCQTLIPVQRTQLPHDHVGSGAIFDVPD